MSPLDSHVPHAVVINLGYTGLALARSLGRRGVPVIGLAPRRERYGRFSRYCRVRRCPDPRRAPQALLDYLVHLGEELREPAVLFPTSDFDLLLVARHQEVLRRYFRLPLPDAAVVERVMDKAALCAAATDAGVPVPATAVCRDAAEVDAAARAVGYPCVLKPRYSYQWHEGNAWTLVGEAKAIKVAAPEALADAYGRVQRVTAEVLVQEFVPGADADIFVAGVYAGQRCRAGFTAAKLVQYPPQFGTGCLVAAVANDAVQSLAIRLLDHLGYAGIAEAEFKRDAVSGTYKLIEINPRFWDWHALSIAAGADLAQVAFADLTGGECPPAVSGPTDGWWVAEEAFLLCLREQLRSRATPRRVPTLRALRRHPHQWAVFAWDDCLPFLALAAAQLRSAAGALLRRIPPFRRRTSAAAQS